MHIPTKKRATENEMSPTASPLRTEKTPNPMAVINSTTLDGMPVVANDTPISRWQVQAGMKIKF